MKNRLLLIVCLGLLARAPIVFSQAGELQEEQDFRFAVSLETQKLHDLAARQFCRFYENYPSSPQAPEALFRAGQNYEQQDSLRLAEQTYLQLLFKYPQSEFVDQALYRRAVILSSFGKHFEAALAFERIRIFDPKSPLIPQSQLAAAKAFTQAKNVQRGLSAVYWFLEQFPTHPLRFEARYLLAQTRMATAEPVLALQELNRISGERMEDDLAAAVQLLKADVLQQVGRYAESDSVLSALATASHDSEAKREAILRLAKKYQRQALYSRSTAIAQKGLEGSWPESFKNRLRLVVGDSYFAEKQFKLAKETYLAIDAQAFQNEHFFPDFRLAAVKEKLGEVDQAIAHYKNVLALPDSSETLRLIRQTAAMKIAEMLANSSRTGEAIRFLRQALEGTFKKDGLLFQLAKAQEMAEDRLGANRNYSAILELYPSSPFADDAQIGMARNYDHEQNFKSALMEYKRYLDQFPGAEFAQQAQDRVNYLSDYMLIDTEKGNTLVREFLTRQATGDRDAMQVLQWAEQQIDVFHDYRQALPLLRNVLARTGSEGVDKLKLLYDMAFCHSMLMKKYAGDGQTGKSDAHRDSLYSIVSVMEKNFVASDWSRRGAYLAAKARSNAIPDRNGKAVLLDSTINRLKIAPGLDSALADLKIEYAKAVVPEAILPGDSLYLKKAFQYCSDLEGKTQYKTLKENADYLKFLVFLKRKEVGNAARSLEAFIDAHPGSQKIIKVKFALVEIYIENGEKDKAAALLENIYSQHGYAAEARQALLKNIHLLIEQGKEVEALNELQQRISGDIPEDLKIFFPQVNYDEETWLSAEIQRRTGSHDAALQALQDYLVFYPSGAHRAEAMMAIGEIAGQSNQDDLARSYFAALISFFPDDTLSQQARLKLADLAFEEDDYKSAAALYSAIEPHLSGQLLKAATAQKIVCHYRLGQVSKANQLADDFKKRYSDRQYEAIFLYEEGSQYLEEKNFAQAEKTFKNVANKYKDYAEAAQGDLGLGRLYMILNKTDDALKLLTSIPEKYKDPKIVAVAYINLADFYYKNRQIENAIIACKKVFDLQDNGDEHEQALRIIINAYDDVRLWDRAIAYAREYVEQYPNTSYTISYRIKIGLLLTNLKEYDRAIYHFQNLKPLADADTEPEIQFWIAKAYSERGNTEDAITEFLKVKYLSKPTKLPWGDTALYEAGQAYRKMGKLQRAKELFQRVVQSRGTLDQIGRVAGEKVNEIDSELRSN